MKLREITAPPVEPITLIEARAHLRVVAEGSPPVYEEDTLIQSLITAVRQHFDGKDGWLGRQIVPATWELVLDQFPSNEIIVPLPPLISIASIKYDDDDGTEQTFATAKYVVDTVGEPGRIVLVSGQSWPSTIDRINAVRVRFIAGYTSGNSPEDASGVPEGIKRMMLLFIGHLFEHRESVIVGTDAIVMPEAIEALGWMYRKSILGFGSNGR